MKEYIFITSTGATVNIVKALNAAMVGGESITVQERGEGML